MHPHAAHPAAQPHLSLSIFSASAASREECNGGGDQLSSYGAVASASELRFGRSSAAEQLWDDTVQRIPSASYPLLCPVTASGPNRRPAARRRSASLAAPLRGHGSSQKKFVNRGKRRRTNFFRAPPRKHSLALGSRAHSLTL